MANVNPIKNKDGNIYAYQIQVYRGRDLSGKKLKPYSKVWRIPDTFKSEKAIQKALSKIVGEFETDCKRGNVSADKKTVQEYITYFIELKKRDNEKKSVDFYNSLCARINAEIGHMKLSSLKAEHLNQFYLKLQNEDIRQDKKAIAKKKLLDLKNEMKLTHAKFGEMAGLSHNTIRLTCQQKKIALESAEKVSTALGRKMSELFDIVSQSSSKGLSPKTINHYHTFIHSFLESARKEELVNINVAELASPPKVKKREAEFFEIDEIIAIREALDPQPLKYRIMIYLLIDTGIRRGELFGIRWNSIDFNNSTILINNNIQHSKEFGLFATTPKYDEIRTVSIAPEITKELLNYKKQQREYRLMFGMTLHDKEGYLFIQDNGNVMNPSSLNHWLRRFSGRHNLPHIYPHKFRHSQASILYAAGVNIVTISNRLGHKQVSTTQNIYAHIMKESDKKASDAIADTLYRNKSCP